MLKKILGTFGTRIFCAVLSFIIVILNSRSFGPGGVGTIGLFVLGISILQILTSFVGGSSLVYMLPRNNRFQLMFLSYTFAIVIDLTGALLFLLFKMVPSEFALQFFLSAIFFSLYSVNSLVILSEERISLYNILAISQITLLISTLCIQVYGLNIKNVVSYINSYTASFVIMAVISFFCIDKKLDYKGFRGIKQLLKKIFYYGFVIQAANLSQLLNYRLSYYVIEFCVGKYPLGLFDTGTKLSESVWLLPKSVAPVQYARISNTADDKAYAKKISLAFFKMTSIFSLLAVIVLVCIPKTWIAAIFGFEFVEIKPLLCIMSFGIVVFSGNIILSHYFSGFGNYKINTIASVLGLIITVCCLIPLLFFTRTWNYMFLLKSVSCVTVLSYSVSFIYTLRRFLKDSKAVLRDFAITKDDVSIFRREIKKIMKHA